MIQFLVCLKPDLCLFLCLFLHSQTSFIFHNYSTKDTTQLAPEHFQNIFIYLTKLTKGFKRNICNKERILIYQSMLASPFLVFSLSLSKFFTFNSSSSFWGMYSVSFSEFGTDFPFGSQETVSIQNLLSIELLQQIKLQRRDLTLSSCKKKEMLQSKNKMKERTNL